MINTGHADGRWLQKTANMARTTAIPLLLACSGLANGEVYTGGDVKPHTAANTATASSTAIAVPRGTSELRIYKQAFEITSDVICRIPKKGASYCKTNIGSEIDYQVQPEMILKYKSVRLDDQEFSAEIAPTGELQFRTNKIDYTGSQTFEVEIIYLK